MDRFIQFVLKQRLLVIMCLVGLLVWGVYSWYKIPIDAFPDVTNVQVMVLTNAEGLAPAEVERLITYPIEIEMNGLPNVKLIRSLSKYGLSQVVIVFEDSVDIYFARQLIFERLSNAKKNLPVGYEPELGPVSTGLGEILQYTLKTDDASVDLTELRTIQDWVIKPQLRSVPGVTEINSFGGFVKQYQVVVDPKRLLKYQISVNEVYESLQNNNASAPANFIVKGGEQIVTRSEGLINSDNVEENITSIGNIVITTREHVPIYLKDIADIQIGHEVRQGVVTRDAKGETVCGMVIMLKDSNARSVVDRVKSKIYEIQKRLPKGVTLDVFYDRMELIESCVGTISKALLQGGFLVILVLFLFIGNLRLSAIVCLSIPLTALICFILMRYTGVSANLMSLGGLAIAIGMIVDANIVVGENIYRHLSEEDSGKDKITVCIESVKEVARPVLFSILIIILVFVPLFSLQSIEGKMFKPLALTIMFAMIGALFVSLTITPVLCSLLIKQRRTTKKVHSGMRVIRKIYLALLDVALRHKVTTVSIAALALIASIIGFRYVGSEFLPYLDEGAIAMNVVKYPTASLEESKRIGTIIEQNLLTFPEVKTVVTKTGTAEIAEDPMGPEQNDIFIMLKPRSHWKAKNKMELIERISDKLSVIPGLKLNFTQPIALRVNELISGIKSDVAIKVFGYDLNILKEEAEEIEHIVAGIDGAKDVKVEQISGFLQLDIDIDRNAVARYGINVDDINEIVEKAVGGKTAGIVYENDRRFNIFVRYPIESRRDEKAIGNILIPAPIGQNIPLAQLAKIHINEVPAQISREANMRRIVVECNVRGRDIGSFVREARTKIDKIEKNLPPNYFINWGGQFENQERAMKTLSVVVPVVILMIFVMLFTAFGSVRPALLVILNLPFALVGGIFLVLLLKVTLSVSAVVGFIALFGIAVENGIVLVTFFSQLRKKGLELNEAIRKGCELRLRPLLLTTLTTIFGLIPLLWATGSGAEIQKPLAIVVLGGLISSWFLTLIVLPCLYEWMESKTSLRE
ncbi:MAG: CusA/CzcA family heavy metal efflux RND transporter [Candidatus Ancaeobacter aquaticus]|nr:CusA/CzcA family heavy metal efflux RND transporter [Candidatus Ancaeobacter aquaticus]